MFSTRAPYVPAFAPRRSVRSVIGLGAGTSSSATASSAGEACDCPSTIDVLTALGAMRAAAMHENGKATWSITDHRGHHQDEDERVIPLLRKIAEDLPGQSRKELDRDVGRIVAQHAQMEEGFARGEFPDPALAAEHAALEERLIARYGARMIRLAIMGGGGVRTNIGAPLAFTLAKAAPTSSEGVKFLDPWFARDAKHYPAEIPWNPETWFDARITRDVAANGRARIDAIFEEIAKREKSTATIRPINYNAAGHALLGGVQDVGAELASHAAGFLELEAKARAAQRSRIVLAGSIAGSFLGMPWLGTALGGYSDWMDKNVTDPLVAALGGAAGHSDWIVSDYALVTACFTEMLKKAVIPPFGATLNFGSLEWEEWQNVRFQKQIVCNTRDKWNKMGASALEPVQAWFAVLAKYARDAELRRIIMHTSWNAQGLAGDSQVLLAATPIARLYGFDLRDFAAALWEKSKGWAARMDLTHVWEDGTIVDAAIVQWIVLTQDAFDLAADWKASGKGGSDSTFKLSVAPKSGPGTGTVIAIGGGLTLAMILAIVFLG